MVRRLQGAVSQGKLLCSLCSLLALHSLRQYWRWLRACSEAFPAAPMLPASVCAPAVCPLLLPSALPPPPLLTFSAVPAAPAQLQVMKLVASRPDVLLLAINFDENKAVVKALGVKVGAAAALCACAQMRCRQALLPMRPTPRTYCGAAASWPLLPASLPQGCNSRAHPPCVREPQCMQPQLPCNLQTAACKLTQGRNHTLCR